MRACNLIICLLSLVLVSCATPPERQPAPVRADSVPAAATAAETAALVDAAPASTAPATEGGTEPSAASASGGALPLGAPSITRETQLDAVKWAQDGGGPETLAAAEGNVLVVMAFPEATTVTYDATRVALTLAGGHVVHPLAVTSPSANPIQPRASDPGPAKFQRDVFMFVGWEPGPNTPFALAFEVPATSSSGTLAIGDASAALTW